MPDMTIEGSLERLKLKAEDDLYQAAKAIVKAYDGALYSLDFLALAAINRTLHLIPALVHSVETKNFLVMGALLRMQLDSCLRLYAAWVVDDPHAYAKEILDGTPTFKLKDSTGNRMTDTYLVEKLKDDYPWMPGVYEHCSEFVHLSKAHIVTMMSPKAEQNNVDAWEVDFALGFGTIKVDDERYIEGIEGFMASVDALLSLPHGWYVTKEHPLLVRT